MAKLLQSPMYMQQCRCVHSRHQLAAFSDAAHRNSSQAGSGHAAHAAHLLQVVRTCLERPLLMVLAQQLMRPSSSAFQFQSTSSLACLSALQAPRRAAAAGCSHGAWLSAGHPCSAGVSCTVCPAAYAWTAPHSRSQAALTCCQPHSWQVSCLAQEVSQLWPAAAAAFLPVHGDSFSHTGSLAAPPVLSFLCEPAHVLLSVAAYNAHCNYFTQHQQKRLHPLQPLPPNCSSTVCAPLGFLQRASRVGGAVQWRRACCTSISLTTCCALPSQSLPICTATPQVGGSPRRVLAKWGRWCIAHGGAELARALAACCAPPQLGRLQCSAHLQVQDQGR